jgi:murein DD-endopeptidase MepM/ murein hydrolase activator NlpD
MMRFKRFSRREASLARSTGHVAAILLAGLAGGCSAQVSGFDFPSFALNDDPKPQQTASASGRGNPSYLGNDGYGSGGGSYNQPRTYRDNGVSTQSLPDASPPPTNYSDRGYGSGASASQAPSGRYENTANSTYSTDRRYATATAPTTTNSTNRYDPQPQPSLSNPCDMVEVQPGDTLYGLSRRHRVGVAELMQVNNLTNPNLHPGQKLYLPQGYAANRSQPAPMQTASVQPPPPPSVPGDLDAKYRGSYTMRPGDSLYGVSRSHGVSVAELQQANGITDARGLKAGAVLRVPDTNGGAPAQPMQQVAVNPPATQPQYQQPQQYQPAPQQSSQSNIPSTHQPTIINGANPNTQVANSNGGATAAINPPAQPQQTAARGSDKLRWPVSGRIITGFGQRSDGTHNDGINLSVPLGTSVHAAEGGTVAYAGSELKGYGNLILLRHDNGWVTAYAHNDQLNVKRGDKVQRGQVIATAGRSGSVDQPQVHFELRQGSKPVDPVPFLERL